MNFLTTFWNSPVGPKTSHFWGPMTNWGFVCQGFVERNRPADKISRNMQLVLCGYACIFMRIALRVTPTNYLLFSCHFFNFFL